MVEANSAQVLQLQRTLALLTVTRQDLMKRGKEGVVDVTRVAKSDDLKGSTKNELRKALPDWSYTFKTRFTSQWQHVDAILKWAGS